MVQSLSHGLTPLKLTPPKLSICGTENNFVPVFFTFVVSFPWIPEQPTSLVNDRFSKKELVLVFGRVDMSPPPRISKNACHHL